MLMFALGFMPYATTELLPEFVQLPMGYSAELAGTALSPGALLIMALMPLVGFLIARVDARWMLRTYQSIALAFLFVPINTVAYVGMKPAENSQVSGLMNLMRNIGASAGISLTGAMVTERAQFHQAQLRAVCHLMQSTDAGGNS